MALPCWPRWMTCAQRGLSAAGALEELATLLQQMAIAQAVPGALDAEDPDTPEATRLSRLWPSDELQLLYSIAVHGREELPLLSDEYAALTMVLLRFLAFPSTPPSAVAMRPERASDAKAGAAASVETAARKSVAARSDEPPPWVDAVPEADGPPRAAEPRDAERASRRCRAGAAAHGAGRALGSLGRYDGAARSDPARWFANWRCKANGSTHPLARTRPRWRLRVERESLRAPALRDKLQAAVAIVHGEPVELELVEGAPSDSPALREAAAACARSAASRSRP